MANESRRKQLEEKSYQLMKWRRNDLAITMTILCDCNQTTW